MAAQGHAWNEVGQWQNARHRLEAPRTYYVLPVLADTWEDARAQAHRPGPRWAGQGGPFTHGFNHFLFAETTDGTPASTAGKKAAAEKTTASKSAAESAGGKKATTAKPAAKKTASRKRSA